MKKDLKKAKDNFIKEYTRLCIKYNMRIGLDEFDDNYIAKRATDEDLHHYLKNLT